MKKLDREFYNRDSITVAKELLGKVLVHEIDGQKLSAKNCWGRSIYGRRR